MKSNSNFVYTTAVGLIVYFIGWIVLISSNSLCWWREFLNWHYAQQQKRRQLRRYHHIKFGNMYEFRPFQLQQCDYKSYSKKTKHRGRGINCIPKPRSGHRIAANETDLFSFGGYNPNVGDSCLFPELLKFNFLTQKWSKVFTLKLEEMPRESVSNALTMTDDCLVLYGGTGFPFGEKRSNDTHLMWPYGKRMIERLTTKGDKPDQLYGQAILVRDNYLYVIGGTSGHEFTCDIHRLNLHTRTWEHRYTCNANVRENDPPGRYRHEIASDDHYIYIFGGGTQTSSFDLDVIPAYSFDENKFISIKTHPDPLAGFPEPRRFHSCVQQPSENGIEVVIAGGLNSPERFLNDIWKFNLSTHRWQLLAQTKLPYKLFFHDAAVAGNGCMYIFGGVNGTTQVRTNDLLKVWVQIPKLSEICWEALTFYHPKIVDQGKDELLSIGVPRKFVDRTIRGRNVNIVV